MQRVLPGEFDVRVLPLPSRSQAQRCSRTAWLCLAKGLAHQSCCVIYKRALVQPRRPKITEFDGTVKSKLQRALGQLKFFPREQQCREGFYEADREPEAPRVAQHLLQGATSPWAASWGHGDALELFEECLVCLATACWGTLTSSGTELENLEREAGRLGTSAKSATGYMRHTSWCLPSLPPNPGHMHASPSPSQASPVQVKGKRTLSGCP